MREKDREHDDAREGEKQAQRDRNAGHRGRGLIGAVLNAAQHHERERERAEEGREGRVHRAVARE